MLTEKISRRGYHLSREYSVDPLELSLVRDYLQHDFLTLPSDATRDKLMTLLDGGRAQPVLVVDMAGKLVSTLGVQEVETLLADGATIETVSAFSAHIPTAYLNEPLRAVAHRMAASGRTRLPVVDPRTGAPAGIITLEHLLQARGQAGRSDTDRRRVFEMPWHRLPEEGS
jgi:CBS domain-containing protein